MSDDPAHLTNLILRVRRARLRLARQIERAIEQYRETTELEATLLERAERLHAELTRTEALLDHRRAAGRQIH